MFVDNQQNNKIDTAKAWEAKLPDSFGTGFKLPGGGFITDAQHHILCVHGAFEAITGYTAAEAMGKNPSFLKSGRHDIVFYQQIWATLLHNGYWEGEIDNRRKDGSIYLAWGQISVVHDKDGGIAYHVVHFSDISDDKKAKENLQYLALYDHLTGLPNRRLLESRIELAMARAERNNKLFAVCMLDLDNFKPINDTYGHDAGDEVLVTLGQRLPNVLRKTDIAARFGGDEFVLLIEDISSMSDLAAIFPKIEEAIRTPIFLSNDASIQVGASMGVCIYPFGDEETGDQLLRSADQALYDNKAHKLDRTHFWTLGGKQKTQRTHAQCLLDEGALEVWYQPILDTRTRQVVGVEALARLRDETGRILFPGEFLPQITTEDITNLSRHVLKLALDDLVKLDALGWSLWVSFNVAAESFCGECVSCLQGVIEASGVDPARITLEILESSDFLEQNTALSVLHEIKALGIRLALDDVGSAYGSLLRLKDLPIDEIKLDQGFVHTLEGSPRDMHFVRTIQDLATELQLDLVVEGVETADILDAMITIKVPYLQGYAISRPLPLAQLQQFLSSYMFDMGTRPVSLFGFYASQMASHTATKRMLLINSARLDHGPLADGRQCSGHAALHRLGYGDESHLVHLHGAYHRALGMVHDAANHEAWQAMEWAQAVFAQAILKAHQHEKMIMGETPAA
jgi:diguanylate cyclase (GGDEF)-like protein/PAS domain S-box-containing protein